MISHALWGREVYKESAHKPWGCCLGIWHRTVRLIVKSPTLYFGYIGASHGARVEPGRTVYLVGLSFLFIETKELCEARAKLEMTSNLADEPTLADVLPPHSKLLDEKVTATHFSKQSTYKKI